MEDTFENDLKKVVTLEERQRLKTLLQQEEAKRFPKKSSKKTYWYAAASVVLLIAIAGSSFLFNKSSASEKLFAQYFDAYPNIAYPIVRGEAINNYTIQAFTAYENADYKSASELLKKAYSEEKNNAFLLYQGICLLQQNNTDEAIKILKKQLQTVDKFNAKSQWYLALAYLKKEDTSSAKKEFKNLLNASENYKKEAANKILEKLE